MKSVKTFAAILLMTGFLSTGVLAQQKETKKEHKCTKECAKECTQKKQTKAHGEKGHTCGDACKKMDKKGNM